MSGSILNGKKKLFITQAIEKRVRELQAELEQNPEAFRMHAAKAYESFSDDDRKLNKQLQNKTVTMQTILEEWKETLQPALEKLETKRTESAFKRTIENELFLSRDSAAHKIMQLVDESKEELMQTTVTQLYPALSTEARQNYEEKRAHAITFLSQDKKHLEDFYQRFVDFTAYMEVARSHKVVIYDSMSSWVERQRSMAVIKKQQQQALKQLYERLKGIETEMSQLGNDQEGLLKNLLNNGWDPTHIQKLFTDYDKKIKLLAKKEQSNPAKQLAIFDTATRKFREEEVKRASEKASAQSLQNARAIAENINKLILHYFELAEDQKKHLLQNAKAYKMLQAEHSGLEAEQQNLLKYLQKT